MPHHAARVDLQPATRVAAQRHVDRGPGECRRAPRPQRVRHSGGRGGVRGRLARHSGLRRPRPRARRRDGPGRSAQPGLSPPAQPGWWRHRVRRRVRKPPPGRWWPTVASRRWRPSRRGRSSVRRAGHGRHAAISECRHNGSPHFVARNNDAGSAQHSRPLFGRRRGFTGRCRCSVIGQYGAARGQVHPFCSAATGDLPAGQAAERGEALSGLFRATLCRPRHEPTARGGAGGAGCGGLPAVRGRRVRSIREGARRPVLGGQAWRRPCRTGRGRAELSVGSVEPG